MNNLRLAPTDAQIAELAVECGLPYDADTWAALKKFAYNVPMLTEEAESRLAQQGNAGDQIAPHPALATWPERIYLQGTDESGEEPDTYPGMSDDLTWCVDPIGAADIEYIRAELAATQANQQGKEAELPDASAVKHEVRQMLYQGYSIGVNHYGQPLLLKDSHTVAIIKEALEPEYERRLFEAHMRKDGWGGWSLSRSEVNGLYADGVVNRFWEVWKARSALSLPVPHDATRAADPAPPAASDERQLFEEILRAAAPPAADAILRWDAELGSYYFGATKHAFSLFCVAIQGAQLSPVPVAWQELCRRLYVELFHCDQQMTAAWDEDGEPLFVTGKSVSDVLRDAKEALALYAASQAHKAAE